MSYSCHPRSAGLALALFLAVVGLPSAAESQIIDKWASTDDQYDESRVPTHVGELQAQLADRHGPLARELFDMNAELRRTPHQVERRPAGPLVLPVVYRIEASHLLHYQALGGGTLGRLHGSTRHPIGLGWMPHSMFAQSGAVFGQWGHARLLAAIHSYAERHAA